MKKFIGFIICFIFCIFLASCSDGGGETNNGERLLDSARNIKIVQIEGSATVTDDTETVDCFKGMNLYDGDTLQVGKDSVIVVKFDDDKYVYLGENSKVNIKSEGKDKFKTNVFVEMGVVLAEIQNKLGQDEEFFLSSNNSVMAVRGTIFGVTVRDDGNQFIETYAVYRGVTELVVFDKVNGQIIKGKLTDISNKKIEIKVPKDHVIPNNDFKDILSNWLSDVNDKFTNPDDANDKLDEVQITVSTPTEADYEEVLNVINEAVPDKTDGKITYSDIEYTSNGYFGEYDGNPHSISITPVDNNAKVYYKGEGETEYKENNDYQFYAPGIYRVYYKITCEGSLDKEDYEVIYITKPTIKLTSDYMAFDNDTQSAVLTINGISNTSFNRYNGVLEDVILSNAKFYINNEDVTNKVTNISYNKKIDNYIELVNGKNTLNVTFDFGTFTINQDVNFLFIDTREDLGYLIGSQSAELEQLSGNLYYYHTDETTGEPMFMDGNDLLTMFGLDVEDLTTMLINYPSDTLGNDTSTYDGTNSISIDRYRYAELNFLVFPTSVAKGYSDVVYLYIGPTKPTDYPEFTIKTLDYAYNPAKDANGILVDFIDTKTNTVTYSLDGTNYQESIRITDAGSYKVYYKVSNGENTVEGYEYINVLVGQGVITFDNLKFITNPVHIFSNDGNDLSYTYRDETIDKTGYVTSDNGTITSLDDAYLVYSGLVKNAKFYDSITKEEINATVTISEKKDNSANFNYTITAEGYDTVTGSVRFAYTEIGYFGDASSVPEFGVTLPTDYEVSLSDVPTVVPSRTSTEMENSIINYQCYYSVDEGKTWTKTAPKITEAGNYSIYTLYCFVDKGNDATDLVDGDLSNTTVTDFAATGNFIIAVQNIKVTE